jgi:hypothetical protein
VHCVGSLYFCLAMAVRIPATLKGARKKMRATFTFTWLGRHIGQGPDFASKAARIRSAPTLPLMLLASRTAISTSLKAKNTAV